MNFTSVIAASLGLLAGVTLTTNRRTNTMSSSIKSLIGGTRRRKITTGLIVLALAGAGSALAAWLITGAGNGSGRIAALGAPTVVQGTAPATGGCLPGGSCDAVVKLTNPNGVDLLVTALADDGGGSGASYSGSGCPANAVTVNAQAITGVTVPAGANSTSVTIPNAYKLASTAPTACMGQTFQKGMELSFSTP